MAGVSPATVSNVLIGRSSVAAALAERVHKAVAESSSKNYTFASC